MSSPFLPSFGQVGHSAEVKMHLVLDGEILPIAQMGPDFLLMDAPIDHPPANAILFYSIDGKEREREIRLPEGISAASPRVVIAKV